jgi:hypothetical protein
MRIWIDSNYCTSLFSMAEKYKTVTFLQKQLLLEMPPVLDFSISMQKP